MKYTTKQKLNKLLHKPTREYEKYHNLLAKIKEKTQSKLADNFEKKTDYKAYPRFEELALPKPRLTNTIPLKKALYNRTSSRDFKNEKMLLSEISNLLYFSAGEHSTGTKKRFYPSAGARYPLEIYFMALNTEINQGIYHYYIRNNSLEYLSNFNQTQLMKYIPLPWVHNAGGIILIGSVFERSAVKYGEHAYKFSLLEAGHLAQNVYLVASALDITVCSINGYRDRKINKLIDIDGIFESIIYSIVVGK